MEEQTKDLKDYIEAFRRRRVQILTATALLGVISLVAAIFWPPTYRSMATILIEEQEVPTELVRSTITSYATQRIQVISQMVMTRANLMDLIEKYKLYPDKRRRDTTEELVQRMRKDIKVDMINADVMDPRSGRPMPATIAFTLAFEGEKPEVTQKVATELTNLYLNENLKNRTAKASETTAFLTTEAEKISQSIAEAEAKLATFKKKNADRLPDLLGLNLQLVDRTEREQTDVDNQLRAMEDRKFYLEGQIAQINPLSPMYGEGGEKILDPVSRLKMLRSEYLSASSRYSPDHPDVIHLKREMEGLEKKTGSVDASSEQAKELAKLRSDLTAAREKYSEDHPDVIRLSKAIAAMEETLKQRPVTPETDIAKDKPENPAYIMLKAQLDGIKSDTQNLVSRRNELKGKLADYEKRTAQTPDVEREYLMLRRDYENSVKRYQETKAKQMEAEIGQQLEKESKGERFSLIDPPQFPEEPVRPNRPAIIVLGFLLSMASGLGYAAVAESMDSSVRSAHGMANLIGAPPLSVIPYMNNSEDVARAEKTRKLAIAGFAGGFILVVALIHFLWIPLDVLWFKGLRRVDTVIGN